MLKIKNKTSCKYCTQSTYLNLRLLSVKLGDFLTLIKYEVSFKILISMSSAVSIAAITCDGIFTIVLNVQELHI